MEKKRKTPSLEKRLGVILEPKEKKILSLVQQLNSIKNDKIRKRKEKEKKKFENFVKEKQKEEKELEAKRKQSRKRIYKMEGIVQLRKENAQKRAKVDSGND
jgi:ribosome biogenesis protein BMS1